MGFQADMVADAGHLLKIQNQCVHGIGVGVVQVKLEAALLLALQKGIVLAHQLPHITAGVLALGGIERPQHGAAGKADGDFVVGEAVI